MDLGVLRGIGTVVLLISFIVLIFWAWSPRQRRRFEEASRLPFRDDPPDDDTRSRNGGKP